ncbi:MAG: hypothetical protein RL112_1868 [Planctomycetota bacterium]
MDQPAGAQQADGEARARERQAREAYLEHRAKEPLEDFEECVRAHPALAEDLRRLHAAWSAWSSVLEAGGGSGDAPRTRLLESIRALHGEDVDPRVTLKGFDEGASSGPSSELLRKLQARIPATSRYRVLQELARGGMGAVLRVWDEDLRRTLAMKVVLARERAPTSDSKSEARVLGRFLEEAQVTGQLDHPGIVPVHELGLGSNGQVYFTMRLVRGEDLRAIYGRVLRGEDGWTTTRAVGVLLKACEAMSYAHDKGVVHRDLKPGNIMVGRYGEVYVMDWGLARVDGARDRHDLRIRTTSSDASVRTERREERDATPDSPLATMDGDIIGTPAYMPPEQARGELGLVCPRSDVYSLGALLYHLLAVDRVDMPYVPTGAKLTQTRVLYAVLEGPPPPLATLAPAAPAALVAIAEKAMQRDPARRYASMAALADDLRAYLEGRVVAAHESGAWAEAKTWVRRNKALAGALCALLVVGATFTLHSQSQRAALAQRAVELEAARVEATSQAAAARSAQGEAEARAADVLSLSAQQELDDLVAAAEELWPAHPRNIPALEDWLRRARLLVDGGADGATNAPRSGLAFHRAKLAELRARARVSRGSDGATTWIHPDATSQWWDRQLSGLVRGLEALSDPDKGLMGATVAAPFGWGVERRLEFARGIQLRSLQDAEVARAWAEATRAIRAAPAYAGLELSPQLGFVPLGPDPRSGLWEFALLQSGEAPRRAADGVLELDEGSAIVFVLVPGGRALVGAQGSDANAPHHDPRAQANEGPVREIELSPHLIAKHELTQAQWRRVAGSNPAYFREGAWDPSWNRNQAGWSARLPVEQASWREAVALLAKMDLQLPSEAQWERAARAGATTPWAHGAAPASMAGMANLADRHARAVGGGDWPGYDDELDDGWLATAPVGTFGPNAWGLHDMHGNVAEWCLDAYAPDAYARFSGTDPVQLGEGGLRVHRGGSFYSPSTYARLSDRGNAAIDTREGFLGLRPARRLDP